MQSVGDLIAKSEVLGLIPSPVTYFLIIDQNIFSSIFSPRRTVSVGSYW